MKIQTKNKKKMKKFWLIPVLSVVAFTTATAQDDDLYFVPKKTAETVMPTAKSPTVADAPTYYCGSNRDVDEYNRRGRFHSTYQPIGEGNDIIDFVAGDGLYPDSTYVDTLFAAPQADYWDEGFDDDYYYSRRMSRFDDYYGWYDPWYYGRWGYGSYWRAGLGYYPWYDSWYYPWYSGWYDPWYYGYGWGGWYGYRSWYSPWYYGYGGYYRPYHYTYYTSGVSGTQNHGHYSYNGPRGTSNGRTTTFGNGRFGGSAIGRNSSTSTSSSTRSSSTRYGTHPNNSPNNYSTGNSGGSRSSSRSTPTRSYTPSSSSSSSRSSGFGGGSFGGSRSSGGGSLGGSRSSGGGSFGGGGGGRSGGGGSFGGRR